MAWATGSERTKPLSRTRGSRVRGYTPTCTARRATRVTQPIGTTGQASPSAGSRSMRNGSALSKVCLADQRDKAAAMELSFEQVLVFEGNEIHGLEQNPQTKSWGAQMARSGSK